ncbi:MAG: glutathione S-transferase C-terminal domain-containing protein [Acidimicrobiales bacterium]
MLEGSYVRLLDLLEAHFSTNEFLFGDRPGRSDFGLYGQLSQLVGWDPTSAAIAIDRSPRTVSWVARLDDLASLPDRGDDAWVAAETIPATTIQLLAEIGRTYVPFLLANQHAIDTGADELSCTIDGIDYRQGPFKYQSKCLGWLRDAYAALDHQSRSAVDPILTRTGCAALFGD